MTAAPVLDVADLRVRFNTDSGVVPAVNGVSFSLARGETLALVGESGSGKSVTSLAIMRLTPTPPICEVSGSVVLRDAEWSVRGICSRCLKREMREIRGSRVAMIFQEPATSLNPVLTLGEQIAEPIRYHRGTPRAAAAARGGTAAGSRGYSRCAPTRLASYPHQLSGGMRQRAMIAIALACEPAVLIADEPTTALDVTVQAQILELLRELQARTGMALMFITHNLGVVAEMADRVIVMYAGRVVEQAPLQTLFRRPLMPYTDGLLRSVPRLSSLHEPLEAIPGNVPDPAHLPNGCSFAPRCEHAEAGRCDTAVPELESADAGSSRPLRPLARIDANSRWPAGEPMTAKPSWLSTHCPRNSRCRGVCPFAPRETVKAVDGVSFTVTAGEVLGLVGESGSGKTTLGRTVLRLLEPNDGSIHFRNRDITHLSRNALRPIRREMQLVFQDPFGSLNPRMTIGRIIAAPLLIHRPELDRNERRDLIAAALRRVGMQPAYAERYPHEFSGGQRQRVGIARALILRPELPGRR